MPPIRSKGREDGQSTSNNKSSQFTSSDIGGSTAAKLNFAVKKRSTEGPYRNRPTSMSKETYISRHETPIDKQDILKSIRRYPGNPSTSKLPDIQRLEVLNDIAITSLIDPEDDGRPNLVVSKYDSLFLRSVEHLNGQQFSGYNSTGLFNFSLPRVPVDSEHNINDIHRILSIFDMDYKYGPCVGMTRLQRWDRAHNMGLNPPAEVRF